MNISPTNNHKPQYPALTSFAVAAALAATACQQPQPLAGVPVAPPQNKQVQPGKDSKLLPGDAKARPERRPQRTAGTRAPRHMLQGQKTEHPQQNPPGRFAPTH